METNMITVNSLSGGKTSSFMAVNYPANYEVFALVCNEDPKCAHKDPAVNKYVIDKLQKYSTCKEFIGTPEDPKTLKIIMDLEQLIGREIIWLRGESFEEVTRKRKAIPNQQKRFCTTEMKLNPIFWFCKTWIGEMVKMRCGFRFDEQERAQRFTTEYKFAYKGQYYIKERDLALGYAPEYKKSWGKQTAHLNIYKHSKQRHRWASEEWRIGDFPLIHDCINVWHVQDFWKQYQGFDFPDDSNCQMCFWKQLQQLRKNFDINPAQMHWAKGLEIERNRTFKEISLAKIEHLGLQSEFNFGTGSGCQAGFCTD